MGKLTKAEENAIFKVKPQDKAGNTSGPTWKSLANKYDVSASTAQKAWANANLRKKERKDKALTTNRKNQTNLQDPLSRQIASDSKYLKTQEQRQKKLNKTGGGRAASLNAIIDSQRGGLSKAIKHLIPKV